MQNEPKNQERFEAILVHSTKPRTPLTAACSFFRFAKNALPLAVPLSLKRVRFLGLRPMGNEQFTIRNKAYLEGKWALNGRK
ncbi:MAG: hypothetical protein R2773_04615 [Flavobacteriaceae bacterium]